MARSNRLNLEALEDRYNPSSIPTMDLSLVVGPNSEENHPSSATIVFVDSELLSKVPSAEWEGSTLFHLYHDKDFVSQISIGLASGSKWDVVRLITHGSDGAVHLGSQEIDTTTLEVRSGEISGWNQYLAPGADILLYGCNVAATHTGCGFVNSFAKLTNTNFYASNNTTGYNGDLTLEYTTGTNETFMKSHIKDWFYLKINLPQWNDFTYDTFYQTTEFGPWWMSYVAITGYSGQGGAVKIPESINGYYIQAIGKNAFKDNTKLTSISLETTRNDIFSLVDFGAFEGCILLTSVHVPNIKYVGSRAFRNCESLKDINLSYTEDIRDYAFDGCANLKTVTLNSILETSYFLTNLNDSNPINDPFYNCGSLSSFTISNENSILSVNKEGFLCNKSGNQLIMIPNAYTGTANISKNIEFVYYSAFASCNKIDFFMVESGNRFFNNDTQGILYRNTWLVRCPISKFGNITIPPTTTHIGTLSFFGCISIIKITTPDNLKEIGTRAFANCTSLENIILSDNISAIGSYAFLNCQFLKTVILPIKMQEISVGLFKNCSSLELVTFQEEDNTLNHIGYINAEAFWYCSKLNMKFYSIPPSFEPYWTGSSPFLKNPNLLPILYNFKLDPFWNFSSQSQMVGHFRAEGFINFTPFNIPSSTSISIKNSDITYGENCIVNIVVNTAIKNAYGTIFYYDNSKYIGEEQIQNGTTYFTINKLYSGSHQISATFRNFDTFIESSSNILAINVFKKHVAIANCNINSKYYDKTDIAYFENSLPTLSGLIPGDLVQLVGEPSAVFPKPDAGTYNILVSGFSISGPDSNNYVLEQLILPATIYPKELNISGITGIDKIYDGTYTASLSIGYIKVIGAIFDDTFIITGTPYGLFTSVDAGLNDIIIRGIEISGSNLKNYIFNPKTNATIIKKTAYIQNAFSIDKVYDGSLNAEIDASNAILIDTIPEDNAVLAGYPKGVFDSPETGYHFVSINGFEIAGHIGQNYNLIQPTSFANIYPKPVTTTDVFVSDKTYDGNTYAFVNSWGLNLIGVVLGDSVSLSGTPIGIFDSPNVGKRNVTISGLALSGPNSGNYLLVQPSASANILAKEIQITGTTTNNKIYDGNTNAFINTEFSVLDGILPGDSVYIIDHAIGYFESSNAGYNNVIVEGFEISGSSSANYSLLQPIAKATIEPKYLTISGISGQEKVYDGNKSATLIKSNCTLFGIINNDDVFLVDNSVGIFQSANIGKQNISIIGFDISGTSSPNYTIIQPSTEAYITAKPLTIIANDNSKIYGENLPVLTAKFEGLAEGDSSDSVSGLSISTTAVASSNIGIYPIFASVANPGNYTITFINGTLNITKAILHIKADDKTKVYGSDLPVFTTTISGLVNGDNPSSIVGLGVTTSSSNSSFVGNYTLKPTGTNPNYDISLIDGKLTVTKAALSILADNKSKVYGSKLPEFTATVSGLVNGDTRESIISLGVIASCVGSSPVGIYTLTPTGTNSNYEVTLIDGSLLVTKAPLIISSDGKLKIYGAALPPLTATYSGLVNGDTSSAISGLNLTTTALASSNVGTYPITATGATSPNYDITLVGGNLTVTKAALAITADLKTKVYGQSMPQLTLVVAGLVNGDKRDQIANLGVGTAALASSPVGNYDLIPTGTNDNYKITYNNAVILITRAPLTITGPNLSKVYGDAVPSLVPTVTGLVNGDTTANIQSLGAISQVLSGSSVGTYPVTVSGTNPNYDITKINGSILVTPAKITIRAEDKSFIRGLEPLPAFTYTLSGLVNGDSSTQISGAPLLSSPAKQYSPFGNYPISVDVSKMSNLNYTLEGLAGTLSINKVATSIIPVESIPILTTTNGAANGITIWGAGGKKLGTLDPYPGYTGRIVTAVGDLNGDGVVDIITGVGAGTSPLLRRFDGRTLKEIAQGFYAYDKAFMGGMSVAAADVDGDGLCEIITGTGNGSAPHVKVRKMDGTITASFYAYAPEFTRGVNLITGDIDGDSKAEIVSTPNWGGGPHVKVFDGKGKANASFFAYESTFIGGFSLALADTDGNGIKEIVTESYAGRITSGRVFDPKGKMLREWFPHGTISSGGMVIAADLNGDKIDEIVSVALPGSPSVLKVFDGGLKQTASTLPYGANYTNGISIKAVDLNADGIKEIVTAPRSGLVPQVRRFDGTLKVLDSLFATATSFTGGIWLD